VVSATEGTWLPDGRGLTEEARAIIAEHDQRVHLRLSVGRTGAYPRSACDRGIGEWWSGKPAEVTCPACLEVVHA
jgi:hypothetical protein